MPTLSEIRKAIPAVLREKRFRFWIAPVLRDTALVIGGFLLAVWGSLGWNILGALIMGLGISALFILGHDAAHGTAFDTPAANKRLAFWLMLPSLTPVPLWVQGHNRIHHGFTSLVEMDWIWRPLPPVEYQQKSPLGRALYRCYRSPWGFWAYYTTQVWYPGIVLFRGLEKEVRRDKLSVLAFALAWVTLAAVMGGVSGVLWGAVVPFLLFQQTIGFVVYLNHTDVNTHFFNNRQDWTPARAQLENSVNYPSRVLSFLFHNLLEHAPHHVDTRIPFYHLIAARKSLQEAFPEVMVVKSFTPGGVFSTARQCFCYDYDEGVWLSAADCRKRPLDAENAAAGK